jgi:hypothetical protein
MHDYFSLRDLSFVNILLLLPFRPLQLPGFFIENLVFERLSSISGTLCLEYYYFVSKGRLILISKYQHLFLKSPVCSLIF